MAEKAPEQQLMIQRIYVKDLSFESPAAPGVFLENIQPELKMDLNVDKTPLGDDNHEVVLTVSVEAVSEGKTIFIAEIQQAGIFGIQGFQEENLGPILGVYCPSTLYPYARQALTSVVVDGGLPPLYLAPVDFEAMYSQRKDGESAEAEKETQH